MQNFIQLVWSSIILVALTAFHLQGPGRDRDVIPIPHSYLQVSCCTSSVGTCLRLRIPLRLWFYLYRNVFGILYVIIIQVRE